ncbi:DUF1127 domain-containing protein [Stappia sp. BW2]|uniref:DUF1127 domain-containing protein n=1 Tax=Stappia sp. BW2 TaxID=2592622 RepID=UPI0011DED842|nr:DUF1127 domain-containing protein [Stappia sp. BW2]TYC72375.1 DUF1127 domain-containing protein [Stappia sp. BW2]
MAFDLLTGFVRDLRASRKVAGEITRLNHMSDVQLADLGIHRSEITSRAFARHFKQR